MEAKVNTTLESTVAKLDKKLTGVDSKLSASREIDQLIQLFKITNGLQKFKNKNICDEALLYKVYSWANTIV